MAGANRRWSLRSPVAGECGVCRAVGLSPCAACAIRLPRPPFLAPPVGLDGFYALIGYEATGRSLITAVKHRNRRQSLDWAASNLAARLRVHRVQAVTWVPASGAGLVERGFDTGELLARRVAHELGIPARRMLTRSEYGAQAHRDRSARLRGPALRLAWWVRWIDPLATLAVVDDVCTTGTSLETAAALLRRAGARTVVGGVIARTPLHAVPATLAESGSPVAGR